MEKVDTIPKYNLKICQNDEYFKFSIETILLTDFININKRSKNILDLCTGNAPIPIILRTKTKARIHAIELQPEIFALAKKTLKLNGMESEINLINDDILNTYKYFPCEYFDLITINPPYFKNVSGSTKSKNEVKAKARHEMSISLDDIIKIAKTHLKNNGYFVMIQRSERFIEIIDKLVANSLIPKRVQFVYTNREKEAKLFIVEASKSGKMGLKILNPIFINGR